MACAAQHNLSGAKVACAGLRGTNGKAKCENRNYDTCGVGIAVAVGMGFRD